MEPRNVFGPPVENYLIERRANFPAMGTLGQSWRNQEIPPARAWMVEAWAHHLTTAAAPGVVLCVADGIVRIVVHVVASEDLGGRLRRRIDRLIGVAAGEDKRCDHDRDAEPHGRFPTHWTASGTFVRRCAREVGHHVLRSRGWRSHETAQA
jgi:hypothetical protein